MALNQRFAAENRPAVRIKEVPETLEDEDLIEMVNAGLIPRMIVDGSVSKVEMAMFTLPVQRHSG